MECSVPHEICTRYCCDIFVAILSVIICPYSWRLLHWLPQYQRRSPAKYIGNFSQYLSRSKHTKKRENEPSAIFLGCTLHGTKEPWWRHQMETFSALQAFVRGFHRSPVNTPHKGQWRGALMLSLICALKKWLSKQSWGWWFEMPTRSLWRHCNAYIEYLCKDYLNARKMYNVEPIDFAHIFNNQKFTAWISYCIKRWDVVTHPLLNFNGGFAKSA